jgi:AraC-like DNA-binding protein
MIQIKAFIDERLADPDLSPETIAAAHDISVRCLHQLFDSQEQSVAGWISRRRLEACRRDLLNSALDSYPVSAVGIRWGLKDAGHFSRVFRKAYGVAPKEYRLTRSEILSPETPSTS